MSFNLQNVGLCHYYKGFKIERKQNSCNYFINGLVTTFVTIADVKSYIDDLQDRQRKLKPKHL